jgi:glutamate racemase
MNNNPIGIFDSGVGGLTILSQLKNSFPHESFIYVGDSARAPYGEKTEEELFQINKEIINFLLNKKIKLLVMACNTSCAALLPRLEKEFDIPIVGLISYAATAALQNSNNNKIAIIATTRTVSQHTYKIAITKEQTDCEVLELACPKLVPIVEEGNIYTVDGFSAAKEYFNQILEFGADTVIYGCSHYPYFEPIFKKYVTKPLKFIDPAKTQISEVKRVLDEKKLHSSPDIKSTTEFWVSGNKNNFAQFTKRHFNWGAINISDYQIG